MLSCAFRAQKKKVVLNLEFEIWNLFGIWNLEFQPVCRLRSGGQVHFGQPDAALSGDGV